jgi:hypothetical protein
MSSHVGAVPAVQPIVALQLSTPLQNRPSLQRSFIATCVHTPSIPHASSVHAIPSSHSAALVQRVFTPVSTGGTLRSGIDVERSSTTASMREPESSSGTDGSLHAVHTAVNANSEPTGSERNFIASISVTKVLDQ